MMISKRTSRASTALVIFAVLMLLSAWTGAQEEEILDVGVVVVAPGHMEHFAVRYLTTYVLPVSSAVQIDINFDSQNTPIPEHGNTGEPDCWANPAVGKDDMSFAFHPVGCTGANCTRVRAVVFAVNNLSALPIGADLFYCNVAPPAGATPGNYSLFVTEALGSDFLGFPVPITVSDGFVSVPSAGC